MNCELIFSVRQPFRLPYNFYSYSNTNVVGSSDQIVVMVAARAVRVQEDLINLRLVFLNDLSRCSKIAQTVCQSCAQLSNKWTYDSTWRLLSAAFCEITQLTCQFIPLFPNRSDCFSRYFSSRNFMAQSITTMTGLSWKELHTFCFARSWFSALKM